MTNKNVKVDEGVKVNEDVKAVNTDEVKKPVVKKKPITKKNPAAKKKPATKVETDDFCNMVKEVEIEEMVETEYKKLKDEYTGDDLIAAIADATGYEKSTVGYALEEILPNEPPAPIVPAAPKTVTPTAKKPAKTAAYVAPSKPTGNAKYIAGIFSSSKEPGDGADGPVVVGRIADGKLEFMLAGAGKTAKSAEILYTNDMAKARRWRTLYAATDYISKRINPAGYLICHTGDAQEG